MADLGSYRPHYLASLVWAFAQLRQQPQYVGPGLPSPVARLDEPAGRPSHQGDAAARDGGLEVQPPPAASPPQVQREPLPDPCELADMMGLWPAVEQVALKQVRAG